MKNKEVPHDEIIEKIKSGDMSRREFSGILAAAGICMVSTSMAPGRAQAAASDQPTFLPGAAGMIQSTTKPISRPTASPPILRPMADRKRDSPKCGQDL